MGLMLFPVSKNSILTSCFGVAWEQVIFVHVWMGQALLLVIFAHMISWWTVYGEQDTLPGDIMQVPMFFPMNAHDPSVDFYEPCAYDDKKCFQDYQKAQDNQPNGDNYTVQLATLTYWCTLVCTGVFAQNWVRRANYELFYYLHHVYLALFVVTLLHASSAWYYLTGGLALWFFDRCLRALKRSRAWTVARLEPVPGDCDTTALQLAPGERLGDDWLTRPLCRNIIDDSFRFSCGQYLYLNIPCLAPSEWHPFTISSAPSDGKVTCHIKMAPAGRGTFTGKLLSLAEAAEEERRLGASGMTALDNKNNENVRLGLTLGGLGGAGVAVNVDGPYGEWLDSGTFDSLLLVAGGIGVTPIHSIFRELKFQMARGRCRHVRKVHLVWTVQRRSFIAPFAATIYDAQADDLGGRLVTSVYCDADPGVPRGEEGVYAFRDYPQTAQTTQQEQQQGGKFEDHDAYDEKFRRHHNQGSDGVEAAAAAAANNGGSGGSKDPAASSSSPTKEVRVLGGRADVAALVAALRRDDEAAAAAAAARQRPHLGPHVFVCGPPGLAAAADLACLKHSVSFHKEVFAF